MTKLTGSIVTPKGIFHGTIAFSNIIEDITTPSEPQNDIYVLPGFIDTHVHGGGGGDTMDGAEGIHTLANFHLQHGTTTLYPTTITNPWENILKALQGAKDILAEKPDDLPSIPGVHLEGPFINPKRLGAQPSFTLEPTPERVKEVLEFNVIRLVTLAPEIPNALTAAKEFINNNVRVSVGHSAASYDNVQTLAQTVQDHKGTLGFTHLYNAMGGLSGREPGVVGAAFSTLEGFAELIFDTHHVHAGSFLAALSAKPNHLFLITDCIRAGGLPEGETELGGQKVTVKNGKATLSDGTLAGSVLTLDVALKNALVAGLPLEKASQLLSATPARYMGLEDRGSLAINKRADIVVLDKEMRVQEVYVAGKRLVG
jgi:N-acetylglucosamine-6-phosphate deacetylase